MRTEYDSHVSRRTISIRLPDDLVEALAVRSAALGVSRNQLIVAAVERSLEDHSSWSPGFLSAIGDRRSELKEAADEMMNAIRRSRSND